VTDVSNDEIYRTLLDIKGDIGGLKASSDLYLKALENYGPRIGKLETEVANQKGAAKVWGLVATGAGAAVGVAASVLGGWLKH
jgi:hypothetical protein